MGVENYFLNKTQKNSKHCFDKCEYIKIKNFCMTNEQSKNASNRTEDICIMYSLSKSMSKIFKELIINKKK